MRLFVSLALAMSAVVAFNQPSQDSSVMLAHQETPMNSAGNDLRLLRGGKGGQGGGEEILGGDRGGKGGRVGKRRPNGKYQKKGSKRFQEPKEEMGRKRNRYGEGGRRNPGGKHPSFSSMQQ
ncbi:hypothetical protein AC1031_016560 [Aphanomyces cochlioides]|nr:hypothetical protein AC1031_016590 [Aphanomyces cochlioides]KAG9397850.1 hypothetical protein AC1031_016560 [Aphanomyces cochlioides]